MKIKIEVDLSAKEAQQLVEGHMDALHAPVQAAILHATQDELAEELTECWTHSQPEVNKSVQQYCAAEMDYCEVTDAMVYRHTVS